MMASERSIPHLRDIFCIKKHPADHINGNSCGGNPYDSGNISQPNVTNFYRKNRDNHKTSGDVKTLERHLSMKKTIRKKIMRDLQQAFVEDPNEFRIENANSDKLKAEIRAEAFRFGDRPATRKSDNFLDMLRAGDQRTSYDKYSHVGQQKNEYTYNSNSQIPNNTGNEKTSFWKKFSLKSKSKH